MHTRKGQNIGSHYSIYNKDEHSVLWRHYKEKHGGRCDIFHFNVAGIFSKANQRRLKNRQSITALAIIREVKDRT